jgi:hypothetical protein
MEAAKMNYRTPGLMASLAWHGWQFVCLRGDWRRMPDAKGFLGVLLCLVLMGGLAEQWVRGHALSVGVGVSCVWLAFLLWVASPGGRINRRLASALALLTIVIQSGLIVASWLPLLEWPVAIWSGLALMCLLSEGIRDGAETRR